MKFEHVSDDDDPRIRHLDNERISELTQLRNMLVTQFADKYDQQIRPDERGSDVEKGGPSLEMASRAALIMARAVHDLQPETGRRVFSTNDSLVKIFPRKEVYWKPQSTTINPWSNDTEIAITRMAEVQITSRTIGPPFRQREMIIPNLVYILDLLPDDAGCVTAMNPLAHRSRIVETGEAEELARFLHAIFDEDAEA